MSSSLLLNKRIPTYLNIDGDGTAVISTTSKKGYNICFNVNMCNAFENQTTMLFNLSDMKINGNWFLVKDMSNCFANCSNITGDAISAENVVNMSNAYYNCQKLSSYDCGPLVVDMDNAYARTTKMKFNEDSSSGGGNNDVSWYTVGYQSSRASSNNNSEQKDYVKKIFTIPTPVCGPNVVNMAYAYYNCSHFNTFATGNKVENMHYTYADSWALKDTKIGLYGNEGSYGQPVCGPNVKDFSGCYRNGVNIKGHPVCTDSVVNMAYTYCNCYVLEGYPVCGLSVENMSHAYEYCGGFTGIIPYDEVTLNAFSFNTFENVNSIEVKINKSVAITKAACGPNVNDLSYAYRSSCVGESACGPKVDNMAYAYQNCQFLMGAGFVGPEVISMEHAYEDCFGLQEGQSGPKVTNMTNAYQNCVNLTKGDCGDNVTDMNHTYANCYLLEESSIGDSVSYLENTFYECQNLKTINKFSTAPLLSLSRTFYNCYSLETIEGIEHADVSQLNDMTEAFYNCCLYSSSPICGELTTSLSGTYYNCYNITGDAACGNNIIDLSYSYAECTKLDGHAACGSKVTNMEGAYINCYSLIGDAACGPLVETLYRAYENCSNITTANCGGSVVNMGLAYYNCGLLTDAACGPLVTDMNQTYAECASLVNANCGDAVEIMYYTYKNCTSLENGVCGPNVISMIGTYSGCSNLVRSEIGPKVQYLHSTFEYCSSLEQAPSEYPESFDGNFYRTFAYCTNLKELNLAQAKITALPATFVGCEKLQKVDLNMYLFNNLASTFSGCKNLQTVNLITKEGEAPRYYNFYHTFEDCSSLTNFIFPKDVYVSGGSNIDNMFRNCSSLEYVDSEGLGFHGGFMGYSTFENCINLKEVPKDFGFTYMAGVYRNTGVRIANFESSPSCSYFDNVFADCPYLEIATLPPYAYQGSPYFNSVFRNCPNLKVAACSDTMSSMNNCYRDCVSLETPAFGRSLQYMDNVYRNTGITEINTVQYDFKWTYGCNNAFSDCAKLTTVVTGAGNLCDMFINCPNLTNVTLMNSKTNYYYHAFEDCTSLKNITVPIYGNGWMYIYLDNTFKNCSSLEEFNIQFSSDSYNNSYSGTYYNTFDNCRNLKLINLCNSRSSISSIIRNRPTKDEYPDLPWLTILASSDPSMRIYNYIVDNPSSYLSPNFGSADETWKPLPGGGGKQNELYRVIIRDPAIYNEYDLLDFNLYDPKFVSSNHNLINAFNYDYTFTEIDSGTLGYATFNDIQATYFNIQSW